MTEHPVQPRLRDRILGTWDLKTCECRSGTGETRYPYGLEPKGMLVYAATGHIIVVVMRSGRPAFASGDILTGTPEEIREAFLGFDAYCGTYTLDEAASVVTHHVRARRLPNWEGTDQVRQVDLDGDQLCLTTPPIVLQGTRWVVSVTWERAHGAGSDDSRR